MDKISQIMDKFLTPIVGKLSQSKIVRAVQAGMMATLPLTLGVSLIAILVNLPIGPWTSFLASSGLDVHMKAIIKIAMEISALYMTFMIGYFFAKENEKSGVTGGILALGAFLSLMPLTISYDGGVVSGINFDYIGSDGIFPGMILALIIVSIYVFFDKKGIVVKLPESVPPMVSQSMSPTFISIIIFLIILAIRFLFGLTSFGNYFDFVNKVVGAPILMLGGNQFSAVIFMVLHSLCWFFGIHPNALLSVYLPVLATAGTANTQAFMAGNIMPFLAFSTTFSYFAFGGSGNTLGLALIMPFVAKSERYKTLGKLSLAPAIFNINEPLVFGLPIMLNPIFLLPLILSSVASGLLAILAYNIGIYATLNPTISLPWIMPAFISPLFTIGIFGVLFAFIAIVVHGLIYLPFFLKADAMALAEEKGGVK